jgi:hypothetical protein
MLQNCHNLHYTDALLGDAKVQRSSARSASADDFQELDLRRRLGDAQAGDERGTSGRFLTMPAGGQVSAIPAMRMLSAVLSRWAK